MKITNSILSSLMGEVYAQYMSLVRGFTYDEDNLMPAVQELGRKLDKMSHATLGGLLLLAIVNERVRCDHGLRISDSCDVCDKA